jgi:hypothetical protein
MISFLLLCRSSTSVLVHFIYGRLFNERSIETYLRESVHGWRLRRGILFPVMGGSIISGLGHQCLRALVQWIIMICNKNISRNFSVADQLKQHRHQKVKMEKSPWRHVTLGNIFIF